MHCSEYLAETDLQKNSLQTVNHPHAIIYPAFSNFFVFHLKFVPGATISRGRRAWSESDDDEQVEKQVESSPIRENSAEMRESDGDVRESGDKLDGAAVNDEE